MQDLLFLPQRHGQYSVCVSLAYAQFKLVGKRRTCTVFLVGRGSYNYFDLRSFFSIIKAPADTLYVNTNICEVTIHTKHR